jgi:glucokinase
MEVLRILARRFGHVSNERILSGPGIANIHAALTEIAGNAPAELSAAEISQQAETGDGICCAAIEMFCEVFGAVAGDLALIHGARGGVYIAGGIAKKIEKTLVNSAFRAAFENKGRMSYYVKAIPTYLIMHEDSAFLGAALAIEKFGTSGT